ncbi:hypothetical protein FS749_005035 [Ceratobasidium sp. UAMH 11750]|nr:hypothetical protein FS749_005035 [Ceratobasidium sp. UAMH 11750]
MLSSVMEPVEHEREYEYEDEEGGYEQGEYEWDGYDCDQANGYEGEGNGGEGWSGRGGYPEGWCGYRSQDEHEDPMTEGEDKDEDEGVSVHGRRRNRKPRQPYTVTLALRKNNWFESSMGWEDNHFRTAYR